MKATELFLQDCPQQVQSWLSSQTAPGLDADAVLEDLRRPRQLGAAARQWSQQLSDLVRVEGLYW